MPAREVSHDSEAEWEIPAGFGPETSLSTALSREGGREGREDSIYIGWGLFSFRFPLFVQNK